jgi:hypothetical protein
MEKNKAASPRRQARKQRKKRHPLCPECKSPSVIPIVHGVVPPSLQEAIDAGEAIQADREEWEGLAEWHCNQCGCDWSRHWRRFKLPGGVNATRSDR